MKTIWMVLGILFTIKTMAQATGDVEPDFNFTGKLVYQYNLGTVPPMGEGNEWAKAIHVFPDDSMLVAGSAYHTNSADSDMVVAKINKNGQLDPAFGNQGMAVVGFDFGGDNKDTLNDMIVDFDGKIYLIGEAMYASGDIDFAIARLNTNGTLDTSYSDDGKQRVFFDEGGSNQDRAYSAKLYGGGEIYVVGSAEQTTGTDFALAKVLNDGSVGFKTTYDLGHSNNSIDIALKISFADIPYGMWLLGTSADNDFSESPAVILVDYDGDLETSFSGDGKYVYNDSRTGTTIESVTIKNNGSWGGVVDEFVFVGKDTHPGTAEKDDCSVIYANAATLDVNDNPAVDTFNFNLDPNPFLFDLNSACRDAFFTRQGELVLTALLYPDNSTDAIMGLMRFSQFNVNNGTSSYAIDNSFGTGGRNFYSLQSEYSSTSDVPNAVRVDWNNDILMAGYSTINGVRKTAVVKVVGNGGQNPVVTITGPLTTIYNEGDPVTFTATAIDPEDGDISNGINWQSNVDGFLNNGSTITTNVNSAPLSAGIHLIWASRSDSDGQYGSDSIVIEVNEILDDPVVMITAPNNNSSFNQGQSVQFIATASDDEDGNLTSSITWSSSIDGALGTGGNISTNSLSIGQHVITANVIDSHGQFDIHQIIVDILFVLHDPEVVITAPGNNSNFSQGNVVQFIATASDFEDGDITAGITWSSSIDGPMGTGGTISTSNLSLAQHIITAQIIDSDGQYAIQQVTVNINLNSDIIFKNGFD